MQNSEDFKTCMVEKLSLLYPNYTKQQLLDVFNSQFEFVQENIRNLDAKSTKLSFFGKFIQNTKVVEHYKVYPELYLNRGEEDHHAAPTK